MGEVYGIEYDRIIKNIIIKNIKVGKSKENPVNAMLWNFRILGEAGDITLI